MSNEVLILHGDIVHAPSFATLRCIEDGYLIAVDGRVEGVYETLPERFWGQHVIECGRRIITQSFCDMHLHAPQYPLMGLGLDMQLLDWLEAYTYPEEARFADLTYAKSVYSAFARDLVNSGTTRVAVYSSVHTEASLELAKCLEARHITGFVGKLNMDRNCPDALREGTEESLRATEEFIEKLKGFKLIKPMITPRFAPVCSPELLNGLGALAKKYDVPVQTHLSENIKEISWVRELFPDAAGYWHVYERAGLMRPGSLMAHCIYSDDTERRVLRDNGVWAVHCPCSNMDLSSGLMPVRRFIYDDVNVLVGSDISGGAAIFMPRIMEATVRVSKLNWLATAQTEPILSIAEAFYLATSAGAKRMGCGAGFAPGDPLHCIVADDSRMCIAGEGRSLRERFERMLHRMQPADITAVWSEGVRVK